MLSSRYWVNVVRVLCPKSCICMYLKHYYFILYCNWLCGIISGVRCLMYSVLCDFLCEMDGSVKLCYFVILVTCLCILWIKFLGKMPSWMWSCVDRKIDFWRWGGFTTGAILLFWNNCCQLFLHRCMPHIGDGPLRGSNIDMGPAIIINEELNVRTKL